MIVRFLISLLGMTVAAAAAAGDWCWEAAAAAQNVSPILLRAIGAQESSCRPQTTHRNADGSLDHGPMGIHDSWLRDPRFRRLGVGVYDLYEPCKASYIAAWVVASCYKEFGVTWRAVGCYNARTYQKQMKYANDINSRIQRYYSTGKGIC